MITSEDDEAFREAMADVMPIESKRAVGGAPRKEPTIGQRQRQEAAVASGKQEADPNYLTLGEVRGVAPHDVLGWKLDGVQDAVFKKLRLGKYAIESTLDLHRKTVKEAREELFRFLNLAMAKEWRCVLISHGRGENSETPARIKSFVAHWLVEAPNVIAYHSAQRQHGGAGTTYVLMRKSSKAKEDNREMHGKKGTGSGMKRSRPLLQRDPRRSCMLRLRRNCGDPDSRMLVLPDAYNTPFPRSNAPLARFNRSTSLAPSASRSERACRYRMASG